MRQTLHGVCVRKRGCSHPFSEDAHAERSCEEGSERDGDSPWTSRRKRSVHEVVDEPRSETGREAERKSQASGTEGTEGMGNVHLDNSRVKKDTGCERTACRQKPLFTNRDGNAGDVDAPEMASRTPMARRALVELGLYDECTPIPIAIPVNAVHQQLETK